MTTKDAAIVYLREFQARQPKTYEVYNPLMVDESTLPTIYGFNNGGEPGWNLMAALVSEDGKFLGSHSCSDEGYMRADLGILKGTRPDRHELFQQHYPDGYRMDFVPYEAIEHHTALQHALKLNKLEAELNKGQAEPNNSNLTTIN